MRKPLLCVALLGAVAALSIPAAASAARPHSYVVLLKHGTSAADARAAIRAAGGTIVHSNKAIGLFTVTSASSRFLSRAKAQRAVAGVARNRVIGRAPGSGRDRKPPWRDVENEGDGRAAPAKPAPVPSGDDLSGLQWDMQMIGATPTGSYARQQGSHAVRVGILDTGIDGGHPDIAPNFDKALSHNFVVDNPPGTGIDDGPCEVPSCVDPVDEDDDGHGTHVAGTVGAALNGIGVGGVAPGVDLVNIRAGQDSGFFLLQPTVDALTYAGDHGIDVVNMSYFIDPWLFNCRANPADSPAEQADQQTIIDATTAAVNYARARGVTLIAAEGNEFTDLGHPTVDDTSPDFPATPAKTRTIDNGCLTEPTEAPGVIAVSSVGPVEPNVSPFPRKAFYSNYGVEQTDVAAPGGDSRVFFGTPQFNAPQNRILNAYPLNVAKACGEVDAAGVPNGLTTCPANAVPDTNRRAVPLVRDCANGTCALYQWIQGTSMAAPHAVGVAALIVAQFGKRDRANGGVTLAPAKVEQILKKTATDTPCPAQEPFVYPFDAAGTFTATCEGNAKFNGFYGEGIVNAAAAVGASNRGR
jgi:lantibiotic leader peptide-processing serine protease